MLYSFTRRRRAVDAHARSTSRCSATAASYHDGWKAVTYHGRKPWENAAAWGFDEDHWELYDLAEDPAEAHDLMEGRDAANLDDPMVKKSLELVTLWWAEAGKYQVLPLDDRFQARALDREALYAVNPKTTWYEGAVRIQPFEAPPTLNRSWSMDAIIEVPEGGATGPIAAMGGDSSGWSLYLNDGVPDVLLQLPRPAATPTSGLRRACRPAGTCPLTSSRRPAPSHSAPAAPAASPSTARRSPRARSHAPARVGYSMDETFDIGWDKGSPVSEDYGPIAQFTGTIISVDFDSQPDLHPDHDDHHAEPRSPTRLLRQ